MSKKNYNNNLKINIINNTNAVMVRDNENSGVGAFLFEAARRAADELGLIFDAKRVNRDSVTELEPAQRN